MFIPLLLAAGWGNARASAEPVSFSREVLPLLSDRCFACHGPDASHRKAELRLDVEDEAKKSRKDGAVIVPGQPSRSTLISRIASHDPKAVMPPPDQNKTVSPAELETLRRWIAEGAPWGKHWAFTPPVRPSVPAAAPHPVDALVRARMAREKLSPSPAAPPAVLLRRVTLDLTGLPPTPEEMTAFLADPSPAAYERAVDRLLASPAYGERMAWDWMEAARFSDTNGYQGDNERSMWPWRDWVVSSFNQNLPWNSFTVWQIAGDLIPQGSKEQLLATAFLRNHPINGEGGSIPEENRVNYVMDMTETVGTVWLGLTVGCARCHDHKFDPVSQRDYYSLTAFFNQTPVDGGGGNPRTPPVLAVPNPAQAEEQARLTFQRDSAKAELKEREANLLARQPAWEAREASTARASEWTALAVVSSQAEKQTLVPQPDGSLLATGPNPANDTYTVAYTLPPGPVAALRLDALRHPSMTNGALGRSDSGNFVLTEFEVSLAPAAGGAPRPVPIASARATYEQGGYAVKGAFDGDPRTGWAVYSGKPVDREHAAVFRLREPIADGAGQVLTVVYRHDSPHVSHNLGRFLLSSSVNPEAAPDSVSAGWRAHLAVAPGKRTKEQAAAVTAAHRATDPDYVRLGASLAATEDRVRKLRAEIPEVMVMADMPAARDTFVLDHGIYSKPLAQVSAVPPARFPAFAGDMPGNRLGLAAWLVSREHPLTARVTVNRFWQMLFGAGLVRTPGDFGLQSQFPEQIELLDWLAVEFRESGWDVKRLLKLIVLSETYRQNSRVTPEQLERDPSNRFLARGPRFRMPSWMIRDQALAASGLLSPKRGGPSVKPYQPPGIWEEATFGTIKFVQGQGEDLHRRSLYTFWRRISGPTMFFDTNSRSVCTVQPVRTNTPLHALSTLNDETYVEAARALSELSARASNEPAARVDFMAGRVLGRPATDSEKTVLLNGLSRNLADFRNRPAEAEKFLRVGERAPAANADKANAAAWTVLALTVLNLDEALVRE